MKCVICSASFDTDKCPVCQFPVISFPGDPEEGLRKIKPQIDAFRKTFLDQLSIGVVSYRWKDQDGVLVKSSEDILPIAIGSDLAEKTVWLDQQFARLPDKETLSVHVQCSWGPEDDQKRNLTVDIPNLLEPELQEIGATLDQNCNLQMKLRNQTSSSDSAWIPLFA